MKSLLTCFALILTLPVAASAQSRSEVRFEPGNYGAMVEGQITGHDYADYTVAARGGQELFAEIDVVESDGYGTVYFNILPPGSDDVAIWIGSTEGDTARIELPEDGTYTLRVYQMGNDRDSGATTSFRLDLSIQ
ncbi:hypothetical protein LVO79_12985 [Roseivivax marinus]|uniref:hypothetical protein n=1 Tax=Roseivivax marinus TaxID=1379903 RepID=UPI001F04F7A8|nr:hypothetical protein [Roseivivax marinus]UMA63939.1 hypothetical protein LVO79_12985 [Roseivivax marinus]